MRLILSIGIPLPLLASATGETSLPAPPLAPAAACQCVRESEQACRLLDPEGGRGVMVSCAYCERRGCEIQDE